MNVGQQRHRLRAHAEMSKHMSASRIEDCATYLDGNFSLVIDAHVTLHLLGVVLAELDDDLAVARAMGWAAEIALDFGASMKNDSKSRQEMDDVRGQRCKS